jgi:hypothetical protein
MSFSAAQRAILERISQRYTDAVGNDSKIGVVSSAVDTLIRVHRDSKTTKSLPPDLHQVSSSFGVHHLKLPTRSLESCQLVPELCQGSEACA